MKVTINMSTKKISILRSKRAVARTIWAVILVSIVIIAALASWVYYTSVNPPSPQGEEPIRFGVVLDLTDGLALADRQSLMGYRTWERIINAKGGLLGRPVELIVYDGEFKSDKMISLTERLITVDKVDILIGSSTTFFAGLQSPLAEKYGVVTLHQWWPNSLIKQVKEDPTVYPHSFGYSAGTYTHPTAFFEFLNSLPADKKPETLGFVGRADLYGRDGIDRCKELAAQYGYTVALEEYHDPAATDITPLMRKLKEANPDAVIGMGYYDDAVLRAKAIHAVNFVPKIYFEDVGPAYPEWPLQLSAKGEEVMSAVMWFKDYPSEGNTEFLTEIKALYGILEDQVQYGAAMGFITLEIYQQAIQKANSLDQEKIREAMMNEEFDTIVGKVEFTDRFAYSRMYIVQVIDGKIEVIAGDYKSHDPVIPIPPDWGT